MSVPHGCNPRCQNIEKSLYKKVTDSFRDHRDLTFHLKNKGITILADSVQSTINGDQVILDVEIPDHLGNVDGHHTYTIVSTYQADNPDQMVGMRILANLPKHLIGRVAEGLNTSVQVTTATIADHSGFFDSVKNAIKHKDYAQWIGWKDNQENVSVKSKTVVSLMWVCNPLLFQDGGSAKLPNWIYTRGSAVFENGFYSAKNDELRRQMLKMVGVLPDLIDLYKYLNERAIGLIPSKKRVSTTKLLDATGERPSEKHVGHLCVMEAVPPFTDPSMKTKGGQVVFREPYLLMILAGTRSLLRENRDTGLLEWTVAKDLLYKVIDSSIKDVLKGIVQQFKSDKGIHNATTKQPALWALTEREYPLRLHKLMSGNDFDA